MRVCSCMVCVEMRIGERGWWLDPWMLVPADRDDRDGGVVGV